jgi:putative transposase
MKQKRFSEERIIKIVREAEVPGVSIGEVCRRNNITDVTFYRWRNKYGGLDKAEILKLKLLRSKTPSLRRWSPSRCW